VLLIEPKVFGDDRGFFMETYRADCFRAAGIGDAFVQDNHSRSARGVLRGLHYQEPNAQGKLVRCTRGAIFDVIVDLRPRSPTYRQWQGFRLDAENRRALYVPKGFAHGFQTLADDTELFYQISAFHAPVAAAGVRYNDPAFGISWPLPVSMISERDSGVADFQDNLVAEPAS
jgi:dTDP-4-dehydrorhamnose 3,5-epimerase